MREIAIDIHRISLRFSNAKVEAEFEQFYGLETRLFVRAGLVSSLICWLGVMLFAYFVSHENLAFVVKVISLTTLPLFSLVIWTTFHDRYIRHYQWLAALCNVVAGLLAIYLRTYFGIPNLFLVVTLLIIVFFSVIALRLRVGYALAATLIYVGWYQYNVLFVYETSRAEMIYLTFGMWIAEFAAIYSGYFLEYVTRRLFDQKRTIEQQKAMLQQEQDKSERLLLNILPGAIAQRLKDGEKVIAEHFDSVSILFADIVDFTAFAKEKSPGEIVGVLDSVFNAFDDLTDKYGLEKIKTIGDAYMVVAGVPVPRLHHAEAIADMALEMRSLMEYYAHKYGLMIRIGISSGPVVAGIIGRKKFHYDLWGHSVNTASRMETYGLPGCIQCSAATYELLKDRYHFSDGSSIDVKGVGEVTVYLLTGKRG